MKDISHLLFRRQFIMGMERANKFLDWEERMIGDQFFLYNHPDLEVSCIKRGETEIYLLGFILDPYHPQLTNQAILEEIMLNSKNFDQVVSITEKYSGRWVLIWKDSLGVKIMNDACGARQVFFYTGEKGVWCGSQPAILAYELELEKEEQPELVQFINSEAYKKTNYDWYGDITIFKNLWHLLPNHYLDLNSLETKRFWPRKELTPLDTLNAVKEASRILEGTLKGTVHRFRNVMLSVTAGYDSRVMLAASKAVKEKIMYFYCMDEDNKRSADYKISSQLLTCLGLKQEVVSHIPVDPEFFKIYNQSVTLASNQSFKKFLYVFHKNYSNYIHVSGVCGEIARNFWFRNYDKGVSAQELISVSKYKGLQYMEKAISKWFDEAESVKNLVNLYDLNFWENICGNWGAKSLAEQDIAIEEIWPYNNRKLLGLLLSVKEEYRRPPFYKLQREIIKGLWKETLCKPINPSIKKKSFWLIRNSICQITKILSPGR